MAARPLCLASHDFPADHLTDGVRSLHAHAGRGVDVGAEREPRAVMSEHFGERPHVHTIFECQGRECVPLRYNYDKPEKSRISRVFGYLARFFILFQTEKSSREVVIS